MDSLHDSAVGVRLKSGIAPTIDNWLGSSVHLCVKSISSNPGTACCKILTSYIPVVYLVEADPAVGSLVPESLCQRQVKISHISR